MKDMHRKIKCCVLFFLLLSVMSTSVLAQRGEITSGLHSRLSQYDKDFRPYEICFDFGYYFTDRFFGNIRFENAVALFDIKGTESHYVNGIYGFNLGYRIVKFDGGVLDVRVGFGDSMIKKRDWKYMYYDAGINVNLGTAKVKPSLGLGVRFYDSRNNNYKDYTRAYLSLGFIFN